MVETGIGDPKLEVQKVTDEIENQKQKLKDNFDNINKIITETPEQINIIEDNVKNNLKQYFENNKDAAKVMYKNIMSAFSNEFQNIDINAMSIYGMQSNNKFKTTLDTNDWKSLNELKGMIDGILNPVVVNIEKPKDKNKNIETEKEKTDNSSNDQIVKGLNLNGIVDDAIKKGRRWDDTNMSYENGKIVLKYYGETTGKERIVNKDITSAQLLTDIDDYMLKNEYNMKKIRDRKLVKNNNEINDIDVNVSDNNATINNLQNSINNISLPKSINLKYGVSSFELQKIISNIVVTNTNTNRVTKIINGLQKGDAKLFQEGVYNIVESDNPKAIDGMIGRLTYGKLRSEFNITANPRQIRIEKNNENSLSTQMARVNGWTNSLSIKNYSKLLSIKDGTNSNNGQAISNIFKLASEINKTGYDKSKFRISLKKIQKLLKIKESGNFDEKTKNALNIIPTTKIESPKTQKEKNQNYDDKIKKLNFDNLNNIKFKNINASFKKVGNKGLLSVKYKLGANENTRLGYIKDNKLYIMNPNQDTADMYYSKGSFQGRKVTNSIDGMKQKITNLLWQNEKANFDIKKLSQKPDGFDLTWMDIYINHKFKVGGKKPLNHLKFDDDNIKKIIPYLKTKDPLILAHTLNEATNDYNDEEKLIKNVFTIMIEGDNNLTKKIATILGGTKKLLDKLFSITLEGTNIGISEVDNMFSLLVSKKIINVQDIDEYLKSKSITASASKLPKYYASKTTT